MNIYTRDRNTQTISRNAPIFAKRGFTLIELLVVIAIIGILAAIILASVSSARGKGADAAIQGDMHDIQTQAEVFAANNSNSYTGLCSDTTVVNAMANVATLNTNITPTCAVSADGTSYGVVAWFHVGSTGGQAWCVDSSGNVKNESDLTLQSTTDLCP